jgi:hypothetical protein
MTCIFEDDETDKKERPASGTMPADSTHLVYRTEISARLVAMADPIDLNVTRKEPKADFLPSPRPALSTQSA